MTAALRITGPPTRNSSVWMLASVSGVRICMVVPLPACVVTWTVPFNLSMTERTTSIPTPRPETSVTAAAVLKPGSKIKLRAS